MKTSIVSAALAVSAGVSALPRGLSDLVEKLTPSLPSGLPIVPSSIPALLEEVLAPALPLFHFNTPKFTTPLTPEDIANRVFAKNDTDSSEGSGIQNFDDVSSIAATCSNPRVRIEWDSYNNDDRQAYVNAIKCLQSRPASGQFQQSRSRYEDLVSLHQNLTPNVHGNSKFLLWHRYYLWMFEDILRSECGFDRALPWFDETRYAGRFADSSIFSDQWYGGISE
jgi:tyrosinase